MVAFWVTFGVPNYVKKQWYLATEQFYWYKKFGADGMNTKSDPKCYQNIAFFLKTSKIKLKTKNIPLEDSSMSYKSHCMKLANLWIIAENFRSIA